MEKREYKYVKFSQNGESMWAMVEGEYANGEIFAVVLANDSILNIDLEWGKRILITKDQVVGFRNFDFKVG